MNRGVATFTLDEGRCPAWLFQRMVKLGRSMIEVMLAEFGPDELVRRLGQPAWFQSLGTVLAFDWNASGLTTILTAALKEAVRGREKEWGIFICGGKGKTSRKTPTEIRFWGENLNFSEVKTNQLIYSSKMTAKVDSCLIQDGYQLYHHSFFFSQNGVWTVVQQGMNLATQTARRYHWSSSLKENFNFVDKPHLGIVSQLRKSSVLDLTAKASEKNRELSLALVENGFKAVMKELKVLDSYFTPLSQTLRLSFKNEELSWLNLERIEFRHHPVEQENFFENKYLRKILSYVCEIQPQSYQELVSLPGVGPKTVRALSLVGEVIYGAKPSYQDPARYSFAFGGKDATPYPVDRSTYDQAIQLMKQVVRQARMSPIEKDKILFRMERIIK